MKTRFVATTLVVLLLVWLAVAQQTTPTPAETNKTEAAIADSQTPSPSSDEAASKVRIVRLSQIVGDVEVDRGTGEGFEAPLMNLPITEGAKLRTGAGFAEVEFEDNSTLRLTPNSAVTFTQLERAASGATASTVSVSVGIVFVNLTGTPGNEFAMAFDNQKVSLAPSSRARLSVVPGAATLTMLNGSVRVDTPTGATTVKKKTVDFQSANAGQFTIKKNFESPYDAWDETAIAYHDHYAKYAAQGGSANRFGLSDLSYYGRFTNTAGCGPLWRPYFATAAWDPFYHGSWVWYPKWGWTWVSPYPWGWTPYHSGAWSYCPNVGWGWRPGVRWLGLPNHPKPHRPVYGPPRVPPIPRPPKPGEPTTIRLHEPSAIVSGIIANRLVVRQNSAGLGIPRDSTRNLGHLEGRVEQHGVSSAAVHSTSIWVSTGRGDLHQVGAPSGGRVSEGGTRGSGSGSSRASASSAGSSNSGGYSHGDGRSGYSGGSASSASSFSSSSEGAHSGGGSMGGGGGGRR